VPVEMLVSAASSAKFQKDRGKVITARPHPHIAGYRHPVSEFSTFSKEFAQIDLCCCDWTIFSASLETKWHVTH